MNRGISCLGLCHPKYPVDKLIQAFEDAPVIIFGWLDHYFNSEGAKNAIKILSLPKEKFCRVHIINGPGLNNRRVQAHEITRGFTNASLELAIRRKDKGFLRKFKGRLDNLEAILKRAHPAQMELAISPWLEHIPLKQGTFKILADIVAERFPQAHIVDSPVSGEASAKYLREKHGDKSDPKKIDIVDLDGLDYNLTYLPGYAEKYEAAKACFVWGLGENGNKGSSGWVPPDKRKGFSNDEDFKVYKKFLKG